MSILLTGEDNPYASLAGRGYTWAEGSGEYIRMEHSIWGALLKEIRDK